MRPADLAVPLHHYTGDSAKAIARQVGGCAKRAAKREARAGQLLIELYNEPSWQRSIVEVRFMSSFPPDQSPQDAPEFRPGLPPPSETEGTSGPNIEEVRNRVMGPAIGLIVAGSLNMLIGLYSLYSATVTILTPLDQFQQRMDEVNKMLKRMFPSLKQQDISAETMQQVGFGIDLGLGIAGVVTGGLAIIAGALMCSLRGFGLAATASILMLVPFLSCVGCCGIGQGIGIWALVVLFNQEVSRAFR
jgi:hypothetical protein